MQSVYSSWNMNQIIIKASTPLRVVRDESVAVILSSGLKLPLHLSPSGGEDSVLRAEPHTLLKRQNPWQTESIHWVDTCHMIH